MTKLDIINRALGLIGSNPIASLTENTRSAETMARFYTQSLKSILSETSWCFAMKRSLLQPAQAVPVFGGGIYFILPNDFIRIFETTCSGTWKIEGGYLWAKDSSVGIYYVSMNDDPDKYPASFIDAFAYRLASDVCFDLTGELQLSAQLLELYKGEFLPIAKAFNARSKSPEQVQDDGWVKKIYFY